MWCADSAPPTGVQHTIDAELTPAVDDPALAGAIILHAQRLCETADHLSRVLSEVSIPAEGLTDDRQQHKVTFSTESMAWIYLHQTIYNLAQSEVAARFETCAGERTEPREAAHSTDTSPTPGSSSVSRLSARSTPLQGESLVRSLTTMLPPTHSSLSTWMKRKLPPRRMSKHVSRTRVRAR